MQSTFAKTLVTEIIGNLINQDLFNLKLEFFNKHIRKEINMKKITGVLSGCLMFFTAAVAAAGAGTIGMAFGVAGLNLKSLARP